MQYIESSDASEATAQLVKTIKELLSQNKKVLWLVSGGSGAKVTVNVAKQLQDAVLENLSVTLSDERYGELGHKDENWQQLLDDGFSLPTATLYRPLNGTTIEETTVAFDQWLTQKQTSVDYIIGLFGIGPDGHTAGIKPHSSAVTAETNAAYFKGDDFERITMTPAYIKKLDEAVVQAFGEDKHVVIQQLLHSEIPLTDQPAQIIKQIPKVTVYSDYKEN